MTDTQPTTTSIPEASSTPTTAAAVEQEQPSTTSPTDERSVSPSTEKKSSTTTTTAKKSAEEPAKTETLTEKVLRYIPGLGASSSAERPGLGGAGKQRSRSSRKKKATPGTGAAGDDPALATALSAEAPASGELPDELVAPTSAGGKHRPAALLNGGKEEGGMTAEELAVLEHKRFSPALVAQKRLKVVAKKLVRFCAHDIHPSTCLYTSLEMNC